MPETECFLATARRLRGEADRMLGMKLCDAGRREYLDASRHSCCAVARGLVGRESEAYPATRAAALRVAGYASLSRPTPLVQRRRYTRLASGDWHLSEVIAIKEGYDNDVLTAKFL